MRGRCKGEETPACRCSDVVLLGDSGWCRSEIDADSTNSAEAVGKTYLWLSQQEPALWTHELDMRPAQEKF